HRARHRGGAGGDQGAGGGQGYFRGEPGGPPEEREGQGQGRQAQVRQIHPGGRQSTLRSGEHPQGHRDLSRLRPGEGGSGARSTPLTYRRISTPWAAMNALASAILYSPKWKMLAASTASAPPLSTPSARCCRLPTPPEAITGMSMASVMRRVNSISKPLLVPS